MLVKTIETAEELKEQMQKAGRDYYSLDGYQALIDLFYEYTQEIDCIAIACDFTEETTDYVISQYGYLFETESYTEEDGTIDAEKLTDALNEYTYAVLLNNGCILYQEF